MEMLGIVSIYISSRNYNFNWGRWRNGLIVRKGEKVEIAPSYKMKCPSLPAVITGST